MPQVTVQAGNGQAVLSFNVADRAYTVAQALAKTITTTFGKTGTSYNPASPPVTPANGGYLYSLNPNGLTIKGQGYQAIVVQNSGSTTVIGGGNANQTVLGSNGGLTFKDLGDSASHNTTVDVGGGNNLISFAGSKGTNTALAANGNNTLIGGDGNTSFYDGTGRNTVTLGLGNSTVTVAGNDTVQLGAGEATVSVDPTAAGAGATVLGAASVAGGNKSHVSQYEDSTEAGAMAAVGRSPDGVDYNLVFVGGQGVSSVQGGAGSYAVFGGAGGGVFTGGKAGNNVLFGGAGAVTLNGVANGDILVGESGHDLLRAGAGNELLVGLAGDTLQGGSGNDLLVALGSGKPVTVDVGTGADTILAGFGASVNVDKVTSTPSGQVGPNHYSMVLFADGSSTVQGGNGTFAVVAGQGGGVFTGGSAGGNYLSSYYGSVTLLGGGSNDYLAGGSAGHNSIKAAGGNTTLVASSGGSDTLVAGAGADTLNFVNEMKGKNYTVGSYNSNDLLYLNKSQFGSATLPGADVVSGGNSTLTLGDGTKIVLVGYTGHINFGHN